MYEVILNQEKLVREFVIFKSNVAKYSRKVLYKSGEQLYEVWKHISQSY